MSEEPNPHKRQPWSVATHEWCPICRVARPVEEPCFDDEQPKAAPLTEEERILREMSERKFGDWEFTRWAVKEIDALRSRVTELEPIKDILAIIHRDGGHYTIEHGFKKSVEDAHLIWADLISKGERVAELDAQLAEEGPSAARFYRPKIEWQKRRAEKAEAEVARLRKIVEQVFNSAAPYVDRRPQRSEWTWLGIAEQPSRADHEWIGKLAVEMKDALAAGEEKP